jgi:hypothetical protein
MATYGNTRHEFAGMCSACGTDQPKCAAAFMVLRRSAVTGRIDLADTPVNLCRECRRKIGGLRFVLDSRHGRAMKRREDRYAERVGT